MSEEKKRLYFGSLEKDENLHQLKSKEDVNVNGSGNNAFSLSSSSSVSIQSAKKSGNINISENVEKEVLDLSESSKLAQEKHANLLRRVEAERRARNLVVPTSIEDVKTKLRQLRHPITLFGENAADRRERLREILSRIEIQGEELKFIEGLTGQSTSGGSSLMESSSSFSGTTTKPIQAHDKLFYIPLKSNLAKTARQEIAKFSFELAEERLKRQRTIRFVEEQTEIEDKNAALLYANTLKLTINASQVGGQRPLSSCKYSPEGDLVVSGCWDNHVKIWNSTTYENVSQLHGHTDRIVDVQWNPNYTSQQEETSVAVLSGSVDCTAKLWSRSQVKQTFVGHKDRLGLVAFHPSGRYIGTASFDHTWRLWDIETGKELILQEGHYKEVYAIVFQGDGGLCLTGDLNGIGRVWDIRSGKSIMTLQGHSKRIVSADFSPDGYTAATGSEDRSARIWDIRKRNLTYVVPGHSAMVSDVTFSPTSGELLATSSFDGTVRLWGTRNWKMLKELRGHDGKVTSVDISKDEKHLVTSGFDRTLKFWANEDEF